MRTSHIPEQTTTPATMRSARPPARIASTSSANRLRSTTKAIPAKGSFTKDRGPPVSLTFKNLILDGGSIHHYSNASDLFQLAGKVTVASASTINSEQGNTNILANLTGSGPLTIGVTNSYYVRLLSSSNTFTGNINVVGRFELANGANQTFVIGASGVNNAITGATANQVLLNGIFNLNLANAGANLGDSWSLVTAANKTYGATFGVNGFTENAGLWNNYAGYAFSESTGMLTAVPLPATVAWSGTSSANWSGSENWNAAQPVNGDAMIFAESGSSGTTLTDNLMTPGTYNVSNITFTSAAPAYTINPGTAGTNGFTLAGAITNSSTNPQTINDAINLPNGMPNTRTFTTSAGGGDITLGGNISGLGGIAKNGSGKLILSGSNNYTGGTTITAGSLELGIGGTSGSIVGNILNNSELVVNRSGTLTLSGAISGSGILTKTGAGSMTLSGNNTYTGATTIKQGAISVSNIVVSSGASNLGNATSAVVLGDTLGHTGILSYTGATATYTRGFTVQSGGGEIDTTTSGQTLTIATGGIANGGVLTIGGSGNTTISSVISGSGSLAKTGAGTLTLSAFNTYNGPTTIANGVLKIVAPVVAHRWSFNNNLLDSVGGSTATIVEVGANNVTWSSTQATLTGGTSTAADYIRLGSNLLPNTNTPVAIELWATPRSLQNWSRIFDFGSSTTENLFMSWTRAATQATDRVEWKDTVTNRVNNTNQPYNLNTEYHIVMLLNPLGTQTEVKWYSAPAGSANLGAARGSFISNNTLASFTDTENNLGRSFYSSDNTANASYNEVRFWQGLVNSAFLEILHDAGPNANLSSLNFPGQLPSTTREAHHGQAQRGTGIESQHRGDRAHCRADRRRGRLQVHGPWRSGHLPGFPLQGRRGRRHPTRRGRPGRDRPARSAERGLRQQHGGARGDRAECRSPAPGALLAAPGGSKRPRPPLQLLQLHPGTSRPTATLPRSRGAMPPGARRRHRSRRFRRAASRRRSGGHTRANPVRASRHASAGVRRLRRSIPRDRDDPYPGILSAKGRFLKRSIASSRRAFKLSSSMAANVGGLCHASRRTTAREKYRLCEPFIRQRGPDPNLLVPKMAQHNGDEIGVRK